MYIVKTFEYFADAAEFRDKLIKKGATESRVTAKWLKKDKRWHINVVAKFK